MVVPEQLSLDQAQQPVSESGFLHAPKKFLENRVQPSLERLKNRIVLHRFLDSDVQSIMQEYAPTDTKWRKEFFNDISARAEIFSRADAAQHNLRLELGKTPFGKGRARAMDNPTFEDHAHPHARRHKDYMHAFYLYTPEVSTSPFAAFAMGPQSYFHDGHQLDIQAYNLEHNTNFDTKTGHALAGAIQMLTFAPEYAQANGISEYEAWQICAAAAIMIVPHDEPEKLAKALGFLGEQKKAYDIPEEELFQAFQNCEVDLFSLSPAMLVKLLKTTMQEAAGKGKSVLQEAQGSKYGFVPSFERDFASRLESLATNDTPLFTNLSPSIKDSVKNAAMIAGLADELEWVAPFGEALLRKLSVQWSKQRDYYKPLDLDTDIYDGKGNIPLDKDSDIRRILWELYHLKDSLAHTPLGDSKLIRNLLLQFQSMGIMALRDMSENIMQGKAASEMLVDDIMNRRLFSLGLKLLRSIRKQDFLDDGFTSRRMQRRFAKMLSERAKQTLTRIQKELLTQQSFEIPQPHEEDVYTQTALLQNYDARTQVMQKAIDMIHDSLPKTARTRFEKLREKLLEEKARVLDDLTKQSDTIRTYSPITIAHMKQECDTVLAKIYDDYNLSQKERDEQNERYYPGESMSLLFDGSYDSTRTEEDSPMRRDQLAA